MASNLDKFCPFREFAPSRFIFFRGMPHHLYRSAAAFFSELLFRGVTFNTDFLKQAPDPSDTTNSSHNRVFFKDYDEWMELKVSLGREETYYCIMAAYGQPTSQRHSDNASHYWQAALDWERTFGNAELPIPYAAYQDFIQKQRKTKNLYAMGDLMLMLVLGIIIL